MQVSNYGVFV